MGTSRLRLLALRPPRAPRLELQPETLGVKNGTTYERRLTVLLRRAWPLVEEAVRAGGAHLGHDPDALTSAVAVELFERGSVERPDDDPAARWEEAEPKIEALMEEKGLDLDLACASLGLDMERVRARCVEDPLLASRLEIAFLRGTARLHGVVWDQAMNGRERSALALLQARDPRYAPTLKVEISEAQILSSPAWTRVLGRVLGVFAGVVPEGGEDYRRGWADAMTHARQRATEDLGDG
jgi:hypothetical protein